MGIQNIVTDQDTELLDAEIDEFSISMSAQHNFSCANEGDLESLIGMAMKLGEMRERKKWQEKVSTIPDGFVLVLEKNISDWYLDETESMYLEEMDHWACDIEIGEVVTVARKKIFDGADQYVAKVYIDEDDINWQLFDKKSEAQKAADHCKAMIEAVEAGE